MIPKAWPTRLKPGIDTLPREEAIRVLDLFCGGGGSSFGARSGGAEILCGIDQWATATANYEKNFPGSKPRTSKLEAIQLKQLRDDIGDIDILLSSPECTNHSCAKGSAPRSEASRATALETIRFAKFFEPEWVVIENVVNMRPWSRYGELKDELKAHKYKIIEPTLDSSDFGVPQKRKRLFLIARRNEQPVFQAPNRRKQRTVADILDPQGSWKTSPLFSNRRSAATLERAKRAMESLEDGAPFLLVYYGSDGSGGWQRLDRPLRTITTVDRFALVEKIDGEYRMRMLQVPELARAMGFTKSYKFAHGTRRDQVKMLGNGVCPPVMRDIVKSIRAQSAPT